MKDNGKQAKMAMPRPEKLITEPRMLVLCCDGTSNEPTPAGADSGATNVVRLYRCLKKNDAQIVFYDPGVGTSGILDLWHRRTNSAKAYFEQATGYGLDEHVLTGYRFLCETYRKGDRICIFGFSRGAYTARVISGLIHQIGLLRPEQSNIAAFALKAYKESSDGDDLSIGWRFARTVGTQAVRIHFLGLWDTVGSMIAPLKDRIGFGLTLLPFTRSNPSVARVRHAMAIDERRRMFRISHWRPGPFVENPFDKDAAPQSQDIKQIWFAGAHGDVGGGHPEAESGLAKLSLKWMAGEAAQAGIAIDRAALTRVTTNQKKQNGQILYVADDPNGQIHATPKGWFWWSQEYLPKAASMREWPKRKSVLGCYLPAAEPRVIAPGATIHESVAARMTGHGYAPENLGSNPDLFKIEVTTSV
jgi:uncharacterized protein (DUF2235 family)